MSESVCLLLRPQLDRVWGRGDGAILMPKFTGIAVFVSEISSPYVRLLGVYKHSFGAAEGSKGGACIIVLASCGINCQFAVRVFRGLISARFSVVTHFLL